VWVWKGSTSEAVGLAPLCAHQQLRAAHPLPPTPSPPPTPFLAQIIFRSHSSEIGWLGYAKNWIALAILVGMLVGIASERVHRMWCAFIAAAFMMGLLLWMNMVSHIY